MNILKALKYATCMEVKDLIEMLDSFNVLLAIQCKINKAFVNKIIRQVALFRRKSVSVKMRYVLAALVKERIVMTLCQRKI